MTKDYWGEMDKIFEEAAKKAIDETHATGRPITHGDERGVYRLYPDNGRKEYIKLNDEQKGADNDETA